MTVQAFKENPVAIIQEHIKALEHELDNSELKDPNHRFMLATELRALRDLRTDIVQRCY